MHRLESRPLTASQPRSRERATTPDGLSVWLVDDSTKVLPDDVQTAAWLSASNGLKVDGAAGETVAFQVILASSAASPRVEIDVSALEGPSRQIPLERVDAFLESYLNCPPVAAKVVSLGPGEYPDALIPLWERGPGTRGIASPFALLPRRNQALWVDIAIPLGTPAGDYRGRLRVKTEGQGEMEIALETKVYGFEIVAGRHLPGWIPLYMTRLWNREQFKGMEESEVREALWGYFRMARAHGFTTQLGEEPDIEWDQSTGALLKVDWRRYDALNGPALDGGLFPDHEPVSLWKVGGGEWWGARPGDPPNFGGDHNKDADLTPPHRRALREYVAEIERHFGERHWTRPRLFMYWVDEPDFDAHPKYEALIKAYGEVLHAAGKRVGQLLTTDPDDRPALKGSVDIWATWAGGYVPSRMKPRQKLGEQTWFYQQHEPFVGGQCVNDEGLAMRTWPWIAWRHDVDGIFLWAGNFWNEDPYRDPKNWNKDLLGNGTFFYPGRLLSTLGLPNVRGPVSSFRMKALRRGLQDYEYFHLLRELGGDPGPSVTRIVRSALNEVGSNPAWTHPRWQQHGDWSHDPAEWDSTRRHVAEEILARLRSQGSRPAP